MEALEVVRQRHVVRRAAQESAARLESEMANLGNHVAVTGSIIRVELGQDDRPIANACAQAREAIDRVTQSNATIAKLEVELEKAQKFRLTALLTGTAAAAVLVLIIFAMMK